MNGGVLAAATAAMAAVIASEHRRDNPVDVGSLPSGDYLAINGWSDLLLHILMCTPIGIGTWACTTIAFRL
jgi:hypothetical protein